MTDKLRAQTKYRPPLTISKTRKSKISPKVNCTLIRTESEDGRWFEHHYALDQIDFEVMEKSGPKFMKYLSIINRRKRQNSLKVEDVPDLGVDEKIEASSN